MNHIIELRNLIGTRPLVVTGACVIVLNNQNKVLLQLRRDNHCWGFAGGALEPGETLEQAAVRELFEETGLSYSMSSQVTTFTINIRTGMKSITLSRPISAATIREDWFRTIKKS